MTFLSPSDRNTDTDTHTHWASSLLDPVHYNSRNDSGITAFCVGSTWWSSLV